MGGNDIHASICKITLTICNTTLPCANGGTARRVLLLYHVSLGSAALLLTSHSSFILVTMALSRLELYLKTNVVETDIVSS
jgi:hypothetical protein